MYISVSIHLTPWDKHHKRIGQPKLKDDSEVKWADFIGAKKSLSYDVPQSEHGIAHKADETVELLEYNDFCFAIKTISKNEFLPFGERFETHTQLIIHDKGINNCRMICSSETVFTDDKPEEAWRIRNATRNRTSDYFLALGDAVCENAGESK